jgi:hypothetical protein
MLAMTVFGLAVGSRVTALIGTTGVVLGVD